MMLSLRQLELGKIRFDQRFSAEEITFDEPGLTIPEGVHAVGEAELASELTIEEGSKRTA